MKIPLWQRIPGLQPKAQTFQSNRTAVNTAPQAHPFRASPPPLKDPVVHYATADIAAKTTKTPTHLLYQPNPTSVSGIVGKYIGAPMYDGIQDIRASLKRVFRKVTGMPDTATASGAQFLNATPAGRAPLTSKEKIILAGLAATAGISCGAGGDLVDSVTKALLFNVAGGLWLFLHGMKFMDDGLKAAAGDRMKKIIQTLTGNRFSALAIGAGVTSVIQSSSVTSVITLGLVNAELMTLAQAIGVIAGANIGTTMTGWLFALKVTKYGLPMIGLSGLTQWLAKKKDWNLLANVSKGTLGLGMVFLGLTIMADGFKEPVIKDYLTNLFSQMGNESLWDIGACIMISAGVTAIIQSSSASLGITIALASKGIIPYETAVALALGSNIGTTITAWLATAGDDVTTEARRVAVAHSLFNIAGVGLIWPCCSSFAQASRNIATAVGFTDPGMQIAFVHSLFNITTAAGVIAVLPQFESLVKRVTPERARVEAGFGQRRLNAAIKLPPPLALDVSNDLIMKEMNPRAAAMFSQLFGTIRGEKNLDEIRDEILRGEGALDGYQRALYRHFNLVEQKHLNEKSATTLDMQRHVTRNLEAISDHLKKLVLIRQEGLPADFPAEASIFIEQIHRDVMNHFSLVMNGIPQLTKENGFFKQAIEMNDKLKAQVVEHQQDVVQGSTLSQIFYTDALGLYREILGNIKNIAEAVAGRK